VLKDLFMNHVLEEDKKLEAFNKNPLIADKQGKVSDENLMSAYFDHCVRELYKDYVTSIL